jgi:hypothetical protein
MEKDLDRVLNLIAAEEIKIKQKILLYRKIQTM